jgi:hypothetical protein
MASRDAAKALAEGQRAARSGTPEWGRATPQSEANGFAKPASRQSRPRSWRGIFSNKIDADQREAR